MKENAMTLDELRVAIAEKLGWRYYCYDGSGEVYLGDAEPTRGAMIVRLTGRPRGPVNMRLVPNWPGNIAAAFELVNKLETHRLSLLELPSAPGHTIWQAAFTLRELLPLDGPLPDVCAFADAPEPAEAICRAWLAVMS